MKASRSFGRSSVVATRGRRIATAGGLLGGVLAASLLAPVAAVAAPAPPPFRTTSTAVAPTAASPVAAVVRGALRPDLVQPLTPAATPVAAGPKLTLGQATVENYWYFAAGVPLTGSGLTPYQRAVVRDTAPNGRSTTFAPVVAGPTGTFATLLKYDQLFGQVGTHTISLTTDDGRTASTPLKVVEYKGHVATITVNPPTMTRTRFFDDPVTITVTGLAPLQRVDLSLISPAGTGFQLGQNEALRTDASGRLVYAIQAATGLVELGTWEVSLITVDGTRNGYTTFTVTDGGRAPQTNRSVVVTFPKLTQARLGSTGEPFVASGFVPFEIVDVVLRDPQGQDIVLERARVDGSGRFADGVVGNSPPAGAYTVTVRSVRTGDRGTAAFAVTDAKGNVPASPGMSVTTPLTRLAAMDPARGVRVTGTNLEPGAIVRLSVVRGDNVVLAMSDRSLSVLPVGAARTVTFAVNPAAVPAVGTYDVRLDTRNSGGLLTVWSTLVVTA